jgi:hypothetical protein
MSELSVRDAVVALRSFPRRYREALAGLDADALRDRSGGTSILDIAADAADRLERFDAALGPVLDGRQPALGDLDAEPAASEIAGSEADGVIRRIVAASNSLATRAEAAPSEAWDRTFTTDGTEHPARWIVQQAVDAGASRLREIERRRGVS